MQLGTKKMCYHWVRMFKQSRNSYAILLCGSVTGKVLPFAPVFCKFPALSLACNNTPGIQNDENLSGYVAKTEQKSVYL